MKASVMNIGKSDIFSLKMDNFGSGVILNKQEITELFPLELADKIFLLEEFKSLDVILGGVSDNG